MSKEKRQGLVQVFTGNGKGKTSAALGSALRAAGHGLKVFIVFFMKGKYPYGEFNTLPKLPNIEVASFGLRCLVDPSNINPEEIAQAISQIEAVREVSHNQQGDWIRLFVQGKGNADVRTDIAALAAARGWQLRELRREIGSLEDFFIQMTYEQVSK